MAVLSFRAVLISLDATQVNEYLVSTGWSPTDLPAERGRMYTLPIEDEEGDYRVKLSTAGSQSRQVDQLYRLVFNLSCIEDREPMEVARDMLSLEGKVERKDPSSTNIQFLLIDAIQGAGLTKAQAVEVVNRTEPAIKRAEFASMGLRSAEMHHQALLNQTALILVAFRRHVGEVADDETAASILCTVASRMLHLDRSAVQRWSGQLFATLEEDSQDAPVATLDLLRRLAAE